MKKKGIPQELIRFLGSPGGHSLIVKGAAGTGKTTFALQLSEELENIENSYYMSIRVSDESLYNQFPWLREKLKNQEMGWLERSRVTTLQESDMYADDETDVDLQLVVKTSHRVPKTSSTKSQGEKVDRTELQKLEGRIEMGEETEESIYDKMSEGELVDNSLILDLGTDLPEVDEAYDAVEKNLPEKTLILIDSINALAERYGVHPSKLMNTLQRDLVENSHSDVLYVLETSGESPLDYLGDGVVSFNSTEHEGRRLRVMTIEKLRGTEIRQHRRTYTLKEGRLQTFGFESIEGVKKPRAWEPVPDLSENVVSTGNEELDKLIGGFRRGAIVALEIGGNVDNVFSDFLKTGLISNFVTLGRGVAFVPEKKASSEIVREEISPYLAKGEFDKHVRVYESSPLGTPLYKSSPLGTLEETRGALQMEGSNVDNDLKWSTVEFKLKDSSHPFLSMMGFDTLEAVYGKDVIGKMTGHLSSIRRERDIFVGILTPTTESTPSLANLAHIHLKIVNIDGSTILYGEKPYTELHALSFDLSKGYPKARLRPII